MAIIAAMLSSLSATASPPIKPDNIDFAMTLTEARAHLANICTSVSEREIKPAQIPGTRNKQMQLDCNGYVFHGKDRLAEFMFRDNELMLVWILTSAEEETTLEAWMESTNGTPTHKASEFTAFTNHQMALRKTPHEVLYYSENAAPMFEAWFDSAAGH